MIALAEELEVTFSAYVILYAIGRTQHKVDLVALGELVLPHTGATGTAFAWELQLLGQTSGIAA